MAVSPGFAFCEPSELSYPGGIMPFVNYMKQQMVAS
jgi:hypothetical protein